MGEVCNCGQVLVVGVERVFSLASNLFARVHRNTVAVRGLSFVLIDFSWPRLVHLPHTFTWC